MTAKISQHVIARNRRSHSFSHHQSSDGTWNIRPLRAQRRLASRWPLSLQRGSITQATITLSFAVLSVCMVAFIGFFYLTQVFNTASHGSDIQALQSQLADMHERERTLELEQAQLRSIQAVEERVKQLNLVSVDRVAYLAASPDHVALAQ